MSVGRWLGHQKAEGSNSWENGTTFGTNPPVASKGDGAAHSESVDADNLRVQKPSCHGTTVTV